MKKSAFLLPVLFLLLGLSSCFNKGSWQINSPDGKISLTFQMIDDQPYYQVSFAGKPVVLSSRLGMIFSDTTLFKNGFKVVSVKKVSTGNTWKPVFGNHSEIRDYYRSLELDMEEVNGTAELGLEFRVYDQGAAFRYLFHPDKETGILSEQTEFVFPDNELCFAMKRRGFTDSYEGTYDPVKVSEIGKKDLIACPLLVRQDSHWVALTEAALDDYSGMSLIKADKPNTFRTILAPYPEKSCRVCAPMPERSPWRVLLLGERAGDMIGQSLVLNLNEPSKIKDVSWIRPGKATWPWWNGRITEPGMHSGEPSTMVMKYYTDFAARHGIPYLVVDAGWYSLESDAWSQPEKEDVLTMEETRKDFYDIHKVLDYANKKGVGVFLWVHYASMKDRIDTVLATYARWGAVGIKLDNYGGENQRLINTLHKIIQTAARYHLMVDYHGAFKPTGYTRTWPNYMTCEAVRGLEYSKGSSGSSKHIFLQHTVTIPFTRMLAGPMDFTPGVFDLDGTRESPESVPGTRARQIAMHVIYYSPLQMLPDYPRAYESAPGQFDFLLKIPVTWDDVKFIDGYPGDYIILARRKGKTWWIGLMTDEQPRALEVPLTFLPEGKSFRAVVLQDGDQASQNPQDVKIIETNVKRGDTLHVKLVPGGGAAVRLERE